MRTELFGVFDDREQFTRFRSPTDFDRLVSGESITVGIRDPYLGVPGRTAIHESADGLCVVWGEAFPPEGVEESAATWLFERYAEDGDDAFEGMNGSYIAVVEHGGEALVANDPIHSWECFYTDTATRWFGTDATALTRTLPSPTLDCRGLCEVVHFGLTFGGTTAIEEVRRLPFDSYLTADSTEALSRFVYEPKTFDYTEELASRLERAVDRRASYPGTKGMLMSAGFDSRLLLARLPDVDVCYTLGTPQTPEVRVARKVASQYGSRHQTLLVNENYLAAGPDIVQYTNGIRESVHIHHRGNTAEITTDAVYHGLFLDTLLRGRFVPHDTVHLDVIDRDFPLPRLDPDPDVTRLFADKFGFYADGDRTLVDCPEIDADTPEEFLEDTIARHYRRGFDRADSRYNAMALLGIKSKSALPFRTHLADQFLESFVAADSELIDWHLTTPPEHRNDRTYQKALRMVDPDIFRYRPPDRPHRSYQLNQVEKYLRKKLPGISPFGTPWPDRDRIYDENDLDQRLFAGRPDIHALPPRIKLRINDARTWLDYAAGDTISTPYGLVRSESVL
ncbi:asparagine synthase-related protein [Halalkalicoccus sp. NIPERK01]|uniref:asparagine synthase-related protein n=1 Tax=Halalkalicoccus sp. NIPERK01 TaxID=3053469 RepID=UPI00256F18A7|nr:asparagine synthase-related protein [Halalkalicoccus sp. NIPERK01]MDL5363597.1 asparagine synthase-related protein [Halalkalicoccus sp. NIPERK01]